MRIISLYCENFKGIRAIRWNPGPHANTISGRNGAGKSSVLDAIWASIGGAKVSPEVPIREGAGSAITKVDLGDIRISRSFTSSGTYLVVEDAAGNPKRAPQSLLDGLASSLGMDPLAFANADDKTQVQMLLKTIGIDVSDLDEKAKQLAEERREKTKEAKRLRLAAEAIVVNPKLTAIPIDLEDTRRQLVEARAEVQRLERLIDQAHICQAEMAKEAQKIENEESAAYLEYECEQLTEKLADVAESKKIRLAEASAAIPSLDVTEDRILLDGLPVSQASSARKIRLGIELFAASNPKIRLALIRDGSLLDDSMLEEIHRIAEVADVQVLIEKVGTRVPTQPGLLIEDGEVAGRNEMPSEPGRIVKPTTHELIREQEAFF